MATKKSIDRDEAIDTFERFHRFTPMKVGAFGKGFTIPSQVRRAGAGCWVTYRSDKVDPATLKKPRAPVDYIHEFDAGVNIYLAEGQGAITQVPGEFVEADALTKLGTCLGFCFESGSKKTEAESTAPMPELYAVPSGKCLLVIQSKRQVIAMIWGGALGVFARGIDG
jgi:hypothetical protein